MTDPDADLDPKRWLVQAERWGLLALFVAAVALFWMLEPDVFGTQVNFQNIIGTNSVRAIAAIAVVVPLAAGNLDLSVGTTVGLADIVAAATLSRFGLPWPLAILFGVLAGMGVGALNGLFVARFRMNALVATLGVATVTQGLVIWYTEGTPVSGNFDETFTGLGRGNVSLLGVDIPKTLLYLVAVSVVAWYVLEQTPFGRYLYSIGSNARAASLVGLNVTRLTWISFIVAGGLAGLAGVLNDARQAIGNPQQHIAVLLLPTIAAAYVGATAFRPGRFNVPGTVLAVFFIAVCLNGLQFVGVDEWVNEVFTGVSLLAAVGLSTYFRRRLVGDGR